MKLSVLRVAIGLLLAAPAGAQWVPHFPDVHAGCAPFEQQRTLPSGATMTCGEDTLVETDCDTITGVTGRLCYDTTEGEYQAWDGVRWQTRAADLISGVSGASEGTVAISDGSGMVALGPAVVGTTAPLTPAIGMIFLDTDQPGNTTVSVAIREINSNETMLATDAFILCEAGAGDVTYILLAASTLTGRIVQLKNIDTTSSFECTVDANGFELIDTSETQVVPFPNSLAIISDGTQWWIH